MKVVVVFDYDDVSDPNGSEADSIIELINQACNRWDTEVGATRVYIEEAMQEETLQ